MSMSTAQQTTRISWVDYAKGICIILVVLMHSTLGVEKAMEQVGWLSGFIAWARPFRMPDFFLLSGLFLASRINRPWVAYFDSKVLHFIYFYVLWMTIQFALRSYGVYAEHGGMGVVTQYMIGFIEPYGTLWFIYLLAVFFIITKLLRTAPPLLIFVVSGIFEALPIETGWTLIDETAARYVYFFVGYWLSQYVFKMAEYIQLRPTLALVLGLAIWAFGNAWFVNAGLAPLPVLSLLLGFVGAAAVVVTAILLERSGHAKAIHYCGKNSIVIYLAFALFMGPLRVIIVRLLPTSDPGTISLMVTCGAILGALGFNLLIKNTRFGFLFVRPGWARLSTAALSWHSRKYDRPEPHIERRSKPRTHKSHAG